MKLKELRVGGLTAQKPIIQGGMGVGISLSGLAGAVAREGGIGIISAAHPGFNMEGFYDNPLKTNLDALSYHIKTAKEKARGGIVGVNIMCALTNYADYVKCCVENKADLIISGAGLPLDLPGFVKDTAVKIVPIVSSLKAARVLLKHWDKKYGRTADMIVVEGPKAGGHLGFSAEELKKILDFDVELKSIIEYMRQRENEYKKEIPIVFGGGVFGRSDINRYIDLGCAGVQMATRFVATEECDAHENFKKAYINARKDEIIIVKSPVGMPGRALENRFIKKTLSAGNTVIQKCYRCIRSCDPKTSPYCITEALINAAEGNVDDGLVFCGESASKISEITTVGKLFKELCADA